MGAQTPARSQLEPAGSASFQTRRSGDLQRLEQQQRWLDQNRRCVEAATSSEGLESCRRQASSGAPGYGPMMGWHRGGWGSGCPMW